MRVLALTLVVVATSACGRRTPTTAAPSAPPPSALDATVVGPDGPVAGARVRMLALPPAPCPCTESAADLDHYYGNEMPTCACPAALTQWRTQLAQCDLARGFVAEVNSPADGRLRLEPARAVTSLEVSGPAGVLWMPWPATHGPVALALDDAQVPTIRITGAPRDLIRAAVLFEDGHCVPIVRAGDAWQPRVPIPAFEIAGGTLIVEATGFATKVYSLFDQDEIDIDLVPATPITGTCDGTTVTLENPFQRIVAKVDDKQQFVIDGSIAIDSNVTCMKDRTVVEEWFYEPGEPLSTMFTGTGSFGGACSEVLVVDAHNLPINDASVSAGARGDWTSGSSATSNERGIACLEDLSPGYSIDVTSPLGRCAGETSMKVTPRHLAQSPVTVQLRQKALRGTTLRGRVIDPDGRPVVGAYVTVKDVLPTDEDECSERIAATRSAIDGSFSIASLPRGKVVLEVEHKWFAKNELTLEHDNSGHDIALPRGGRWTGRVLDPEGSPITACSIFLTLADGRLLHTKCNAGTFDLKPIVAGTSEVQVRLTDHALGTFRAIHRKVVLDASVRQSDIQFPRGEHISGRVVDKNGHGIARAQLAAVPKGAIRPANRLHDEEIHVVADGSGNFTFRHLTPGTWTISGIGRIHTQVTIDVKTGTTDATYVVMSK